MKIFFYFFVDMSYLHPFDPPPPFSPYSDVDPLDLALIPGP